ncbi:MAG: hypothetical protein ACOX6E_08415 [Syntrophomonadaceae bacterium]|jgi:hypothetical protein
MAYWLYCTSCKQWSKSTTPLTDEKTCFYCNNLFINVKQYTNSVSDNKVIDKLEESPNSTMAPVITETPKEDGKIDTADSQKAIIESETSEFSEQAVNKTAEEPEALESEEIREEKEVSAMEETYQFVEPAIDETPQESEPIKSDEIIDKPEIIELKEMFETTETIETNKSETLDSGDTLAKPEIYISQDTSKTSGTTEVKKITAHRYKGNKKHSRKTR